MASGGRVAQRLRWRHLLAMAAAVAALAAVGAAQAAEYWAVDLPAGLVSQAGALAPEAAASLVFANRGPLPDVATVYLQDQPYAAVAVPPGGSAAVPIEGRAAGN
ncbi:MAG TPA: hypothetical protein VFH47_00555, partial [Candidatus Thermoplasmatota archaeon]|nr:hypothetical protein [Candidatus Thermoplasmatota archaeon]